MRAAVYRGPGAIAVEEVPDPHVQDPTDAVVAVEAAGVCGSDLWTYRGQSTVHEGARIGHEFVGRVVEVGDEVSSLHVGDWVLAPFRYSDGRCTYCRRGLTSSCVNGGFWSREVLDAGQGEYVRVPYADATLVRPLPAGERPAPTLVADLLTLTDVMSTGYHAAVSAGVSPGDDVCVVGDGAVAVCGVLASRLLGAGRIIVLGSRHGVRQDLMARVGADEILSTRGEEVAGEVSALTSGTGADAVLECVGSDQSFTTALAIAGHGATVGYVGLPHGATVDPATMFAKNLRLAGGMAPARAIIPLLLPRVLDGTLHPGVVFTSRHDLADLPAAYAELDQRIGVKPMVDVPGVEVTA